MGVKILGFANNLNFSLNKKRMEMMKKDKSPVFKKVKLLIALPIIAGLMFAFAKPKIIIKRDQDNFVITKGKHLNQNDFVSQTGKDIIKVKGKVTSEDGTLLIGANVILNGTSNGTVVDLQGKFQLEAPKDGTFVYSFIGYKNG